MSNQRSLEIKARLYDLTVEKEIISRKRVNELTELAAEEKKLRTELKALANEN